MKLRNEIGATISERLRIHFGLRILVGEEVIFQKKLTNDSVNLFRSWALEEKLGLVERIRKELPNYLLKVNGFLGKEVEVGIKYYLQELEKKIEEASK